MLTGVEMNSYLAIFKSLSEEYNRHVSHEPMKVSTAGGLEWQPFSPQNHQPATSGRYYRFALWTAFWAISARGKEGTIELFSIPSVELAEIPNSELASRLKMRLRMVGSPPAWTMDNMPVDHSEIRTLIGTLFKDLVQRSQGDFELVPDELRLTITPDGQSLTGSIRALISEKRSLAHKLVEQQEHTQNRMARELHDAIIGTTMALKASFAGGKRLSDAEVVHILDDIIAQLRQICQELTPRDLMEWGLQPALEDLLDGLSDRTGIESEFLCPAEIPRLPEQVELHIFRIVQEALNNVTKHAAATKATIAVELENGILRITVADNGHGFGTQEPLVPTKEGGHGTSIIRERTELIRETFPAQLYVESDAGTGTRVVLQLHLSSSHNGSQQ